MTIHKRGDWLSATLGDELVMMSADEGRYIGLSEVGARIWDLLDTPQDIDTLCAQLRPEFDVDADTCRREVENFLADLAKYGAIASAPPQA